MCAARLPCMRACVRNGPAGRWLAAGRAVNLLFAPIIEKLAPPPVLFFCNPPRLFPCSPCSPYLRPSRSRRTNCCE
jgi:hypothetical protein